MSEELLALSFWLLAKSQELRAKSQKPTLKTVKKHAEYIHGVCRE
jgi:hypothetical protein